MASRSCITLVVLFWPRAGAPDSEEQLILEKNDAHPEENINKLHVSNKHSFFLRPILLVIISIVSWWDTLPSLVYKCIFQQLVKVTKTNI